MTAIETVRDMQAASERLRGEGKRIALVPTMGYLHDGHVSLIGMARKNADVVIVSIFVNPAQFGPQEDFTRYPRDLERDKQITRSAGCDILFLPKQPEMYPVDYRTFIAVESLSDVLEGKIRPGHFRGVATVVAKLFHATKPHVAIFGQKDAQQVVIIRKMTQDLHFDVSILIAPTVRENDGLAMSSRNVYLSSSERIEARALSQSLLHAANLVAAGERRTEIVRQGMADIILAQPSARIDYISCADPATLEEATTLKSGTTVLVSLAVRVGTTRLIDNVILPVG